MPTAEESARKLAALEPQVILLDTVAPSSETPPLRLRRLASSQ